MHKALISIDNHFVRLPNGEYKSLNIVDRSFWDRYLDYFNEITVLVRAEDVPDLKKYDSYHPVDHPKVTIISLPMFQSIKQLVSSRKEISKVVKRETTNNDFDVALLRLPSLLGYIVFHNLRKSKNKKPVGVEVVADMSVVSKHSSVVTKIKTFVFHKLLQHYVRRADGAAYVTSEALQLKYPFNKSAVTNNYSSIDIDASYFTLKDQSLLNLKDKKTKLIHVSTLNSTAKGHEIFIQTIKRLVDNEYNVSGIIVGGGSQKEYYQEYAKEHGVQDYIDFVGAVSDKEELRNMYINSDILLFPSEFEGLPRTVIEAMACSLPVVASNAGGIPELVNPRWISSPYDLDFYYESVVELIKNNDLMISTSKENYSNALKYESSNLQINRNKFFKDLIEGGSK